MTKPERYAQMERRVRRLRQRIFNYEDQSPEKGEQAARILRQSLEIMARNKPSHKTDKWGATAEDRRQLARHGICWGD